MTFKRWFAGFFLLILMIVALFVNSIMFSARSFQDNLAHVVPGSGGVIRLADLDKVDAQVAFLENQISPQRGEAAQAAEKAAVAKRDLDNARDALAALQAKAITQTGELETLAGLTPGATDAEFNADDIQQRLDRIAAQRLDPKARDTADRIRDGLVTVRAALTKIDQTQEAVLAQQETAARLEAQKLRAGEMVSTSERQILGLKAQFGDDFNRIRNEAQALRNSSPWGIGAKLVEMHPTFLSTILVCIMGALGAILYLFPAYLRPDSKILFADIVVRLVFGMVVALAFYIVANASLAGFAFMPGGSTGATGASLNPFTVSLLGIIAGIMADDIAAWIHKRGREILGGDAGSIRTTSGPGMATAPSDPVTNAARDAQATHRPSPVSGDQPPRGGVVG